ncbi:carboxypeptidase regulatory-like domain-containing protein [Flavobacterium sp. KJJ]|uniref:carboxypeptidase regulatory-like domain-containing protein n=1 Tax=Flavobacterium sp. KJJ TaxID=1270193 RepID=UPI000492EBB2|nr:carboxypeptidase regulatory-like domain-containing protein [Flavobacterium sp. KJJ]
MKLSLILIKFLILSSCTQNTFSGYVYDFDTNKPIKKVQISVNKTSVQTDTTGHFKVSVNSSSNCLLELSRKGYATKKIYRKPDRLENNGKKNVKNTTIYMFKNESDFTTKSR